MSGPSTQFMLELYREESFTPGFLTSFTTPRFHTSERVEVDIKRYNEDVAIVIKDLSDPGRFNEASIYTNKDYLPPIYKEVGVINAWKLLNRDAGNTPFMSPRYQASASMRAMDLLREMEKKIARAVELQASQVLQTGVLSLVDSTGTALYSLDFSPKATHFPTVGTAWSGAGTPLLDLESLCEVIHRDGKGQPVRAIFGKTAWNNFIRDTTVQALLDNRRIAIGAINRPQMRGGGLFHGDVTAGSYNLECWTDVEFYADPQTGDSTPYVEDDKVIILSNNSRIDASFGAVPTIAPPDSRVLPFLPGRINRPEGGADMSVRAWFAPDGDSLFVSAATRPLVQPTAIDTFGALDTEP